MKRSAFTLIELLVVVAIIAMLISILLPSLSRARETARVVACLSQQRQHATAALMYANDNSGVMPASSRDVYANNTQLIGNYSMWLNAGILIDEDHNGWGSSNYLGTPDMMFCPSAKYYTHREKGYFAGGTAGATPAWSGYYWLFIRPDSASWGRFGANDTPARPGTRALNFELSGWQYPGWVNGGAGEAFYDASNNISHIDKMNVLYLDAHAESKNTKEVNQPNHMSLVTLIAYFNNESPD